LTKRGRKGFDLLTRVKVLIAYEYPLVRESLRAILRSERHAVVVGEAATGIQAVEQTAKLKPDLVIIGLAMHGLDGVEATRKIQAANPGVHVLIVGADDSEIITRNEGFKIQIALKAIYEGRRYLSHASSRFTRAGNNGVSELHLTRRELEVVDLVSLGKSSKEISNTLKISVRTAETHRANIMRKLNVHSVTELLHRMLVPSSSRPNN
jgi:DNA-binding NarL/FixJ family response regulator